MGDIIGAGVNAYNGYVSAANNSDANTRAAAGRAQQNIDNANALRIAGITDNDINRQLDLQTKEDAAAIKLVQAQLAAKEAQTKKIFLLGGGLIAVLLLRGK